MSTRLETTPTHKNAANATVATAAAAVATATGATATATAVAVAIVPSASSCSLLVESIAGFMLMLTPSSSKSNQPYALHHLTTAIQPHSTPPPTWLIHNSHFYASNQHSHTPLLIPCRMDPTLLLLTLLTPTNASTGTTTTTTATGTTTTDTTTTTTPPPTATPTTTPPMNHLYLTPFDHLSTSTTSRVVQTLFLNSQTTTTNPTTTTTRNYWNHICSSIDSNDETLYALNNDKILTYLKSKIDKCLPLFTTDPLLYSYIQHSTQPQQDSLRLALALLCQYIPTYWEDMIYKEYGITSKSASSTTPTNDENMDNTASYLPSSKKDLFDHHDEGGNINKKKKVAATTGAAANKKNVSNAVKALGKASTQGMKKISSFFVKK